MIDSLGAFGVVRCAGTLTVQNVDEFRAGVSAWLDTHPETTTLLLDLAELDMLDSSGLGGILALSKRMAERAGNLELAAMTRKVRLVFEITKADSLFVIHDRVESAVGQDAEPATATAESAE